MARQTKSVTEKQKKQKKHVLQEEEEMVRMIFVLRKDQRSWLRLKAFEAKERDESGVDMSSIVRDLIDKVMK